MPVDRCSLKKRDTTNCKDEENKWDGNNLDCTWCFLRPKVSIRAPSDGPSHSRRTHRRVFGAGGSGDERARDRGVASHFPDMNSPSPCFIVDVFSPPDKSILATLVLFQRSRHAVVPPVDVVCERFWVTRLVSKLIQAAGGPE